MDAKYFTENDLAKKAYSSISEGVYATDKDRRIIFWSPSAEKLTGWKAEEVVGHHCRDNILCHVDIQGRSLCQEDTCPMARSIVTMKTSTFPALVFGRNRQGKRIPMEVTVSPLRNETGEIIGAVEVFRDSSFLYNDLVKAKRIQESALKNETSNTGPIQFRTYYAPCNIVGGDFFAIEDLGNHDFCILQADVMGHGTASALYTMYLRGIWDDLKLLYETRRNC